MAGIIHLNAFAQDDMYFTPTKSKTQTTRATDTPVADDAPAYYSGSDRDVDEYNHPRMRSSYQVVGVDSLGNDIIEFTEGSGYPTDTVFVFEDDPEDDYTYSRRMGRFDGFYGWYDPFFYPYWDWGYGYWPYARWRGYASWYDWYHPWYYSWYDPWYGGYYPFWYRDYWGWYGPRYWIGGVRTHGVAGTRNHGDVVYRGGSHSSSSPTFGGARPRGGGFGRHGGSVSSDSRTGVTRRPGTRTGTRTGTAARPGFGGSRAGSSSSGSRSYCSSSPSRSYGSTPSRSYSSGSSSSSSRSSGFGSSRSSGGSFGGHSGGGGFGGGSRGGGGFGGGSRGGGGFGGGSRGGHR